MLAPLPASRSVVPVIRWSLALCGLLFAWVIIAPLQRPAPVVSSTPASTINLAQLPLSFVPNVGQSPDSIHFQARGLGGTLFFSSDEVMLALPLSGQDDSLSTAASSIAQGSESGTPPMRLSVQWERANPALDVAGVEPLPGETNYFLGSDPDQWRTDVPTYKGIVYRDLYPGIDLRYDGTGTHLKGTYLVSPHVDPIQIRWRYSGAESVQLEEATGDLLIRLHAEAGQEAVTLREPAPVAWQEQNGQRSAVPARYHMAEDGSVGFALGRYDPALSLVIDPEWVYSTYLGGAGPDGARGIALDSEGNMYVTGWTVSSDFPLVNAFQERFYGGLCDGNACREVFVTKISADGSSILYSTFLGGTGDDDGLDIAVDSTGAVYLTGMTDSLDFPTHHPLPNLGENRGYSDAFAAKLSPDGRNLLFSTYLGGASYDSASNIAIDEAGHAYIMGLTESYNFPTIRALQPEYGGRGDQYAGGDVFITKLSLDGQNFVYSTFLGGRVDEYPGDIEVDDAGHVYVTGETYSRDFPTANALQSAHGGCYTISDPCTEAFVAKIQPSGLDFVYSTFLGGEGYDRGWGIAVDVEGNVYVTGSTNSNDFPTANPIQGSRIYPTSTSPDPFVTKLNPAGTSLVYSTYLDEGALGRDIAVDDTGAMYVIANTSGGGSLRKLNASGTRLLYTVYLVGFTGTVYEPIVHAAGLALDEERNVYIAGFTTTTHYPVVHPLQPACGSAADCYDAFITKIVNEDKLYLPFTLHLP